MHVDPAAACLLRCRFVDAAGQPVAGENVALNRDGAATQAKTDPDGRIDVPALPDLYDIEIRGQAFKAHAVPEGGAGEPALFRFVLA